jgi:hypothetical protein
MQITEQDRLSGFRLAYVQRWTLDGPLISLAKIRPIRRGEFIQQLTNPAGGIEYAYRVYGRSPGEADARWHTMLCWPELVLAVSKAQKGLADFPDPKPDVRPPRIKMQCDEVCGHTFLFPSGFIPEDYDVECPECHRTGKGSDFPGIQNPFSPQQI